MTTDVTMNPQPSLPLVPGARRTGVPLRLAAALAVALPAVVAPSGALALDAVPGAGGIGYGRHALRPPRHDLRAPPRLPDGSVIDVPDAELGEVPPDRSLPARSSSPLARHVNWCATRYRSYDQGSDTFVPRAGAGRVRCDSPFR